MDEVKPTKISDEIVADRTGKGFDDWAKLLDEAGAAKWTHSARAAWLADHADLDGWWCQHVTVAYEQARGLRVPGQRGDGTFSATVTRTVDGSVADVAARVLPALAVRLGLPPITLNPRAKHPSGRWHLPDGSTLVAGLSPRGDARTVLGLELGRLTSSDEIPEAKERLRELHDTL